MRDAFGQGVKQRKEKFDTLTDQDGREFEAAAKGNLAEKTIAAPHVQRQQQCARPRLCHARVF